MPAKSCQEVYFRLQELNINIINGTSDQERGPFPAHPNFKEANIRLRLCAFSLQQHRAASSYRASKCPLPPLLNLLPPHFKMLI